jgi:hypothetical protein
MRNATFPAGGVIAGGVLGAVIPPQAIAGGPMTSQDPAAMTAMPNLRTCAKTGACFVFDFVMFILLILVLRDSRRATIRFRAATPREYVFTV